MTRHFGYFAFKKQHQVADHTKQTQALGIAVAKNAYLGTATSLGLDSTLS